MTVKRGPGEPSGVADPLTAIRAPFRERVRAPAWWFALAVSVPRRALTLGIAVAGPVLVAVVAVAGPAELARTLTDPTSTREAFSRLAGMIATASAIAVSVTTLTLGRELRGVREHRRHQDANLALRDRVRAHAEDSALPLEVGAFTAAALTGVRASAARARDAAGARGLEVTAEDGVTLSDYLDATEEGASRAVRALSHVGQRPGRFLPALLDFEHELTLHFARAFQRQAAFGDAVCDALADLERRLEDAIVAKWYAKTIDTQWGLGAMSLSILVSTIPAILASLGMVFAYAEGTREALGTAGAGVLVAAALTLALYPLAAFVAHLLRFVFVNRHTLPTSGFILGPEEPDAASIGHVPEDGEA